MPQLPNTLCLLHERLRVGPRQFRELLDGDPRAALEAALVDEVGGLVAALGDDEVGAEAAGGGLQVREGELEEGRKGSAGRRGGPPAALLQLAVVGGEVGLLLSCVVLLRVGLSAEGGFAATHDCTLCARELKSCVAGEIESSHEGERERERKLVS